jgi:hypothetical protein
MKKIDFATEIRPLFRAYDIESMKTNGLDLSSYEDVKKRAQDIYARLYGKEMPCDGPWNDGNLQKFKEGMDGGMHP